MPVFGRRAVLRALGAAAVLGPLSACTNAPGPAQSPSPSPSPSPTLFPNRPGDSKEIEAAIFDGAFGIGYVQVAADRLLEYYPEVTTTITAVNLVSEELRPRFDAAATPPDLIDNSGSDPLPIAELLDEFLPLDDLLSGNNLDGEPIQDLLYQGALDHLAVNGQIVTLNYAWTVFGLWYSGSSFATEGWSVPTTWDELLELGQTAKNSERKLFAWARNAATYYQELAIASAIKEGGAKVRVDLDNLAEGSWQHPAITKVLGELETCVKEDYFIADDDYLAAQALWARDGKALFYPSGAWIAHEMADVTAENFEMAAAPVPTLTSSPTMTASAIHVAATEPFLLPKRAKNPAGGQELLKALLTVPVAEEFARQNLMPSVVRNSVPADLESSALSAQTRMLADAGDEVFSWRFDSYYGLTGEHNRLWVQFLDGKLPADQLADQLQTLSDKVREDPTIERYTAS